MMKPALILPNRRWTLIGLAALFVTVTGYLFASATYHVQNGGSVADYIPKNITNIFHPGQSEPETQTPPPPPPEPLKAQYFGEEPGRWICDKNKSTNSIPNYVHYVYLLENTTADLPFRFRDFLSIQSAMFHWNPERIYFHTNLAEDSLPMQRARDGSAGQWTQKFFEHANVTINTIEIPEQTDQGKKIEQMVHKSDFARAKVVNEIGGVYIDIDVFALQDIAPLRESGFGSINGREYTGDINCGVFLSMKNGSLLNRWIQTMNKDFNAKDWFTNQRALTWVAETNADRERCGTMILSKQAIDPVNWYGEDNHFLYDLHEPEPKKEVNITIEGDTDPRVAAEEEKEALEEQDERPEWAMDWSRSYMVHALGIKKQNTIKPGLLLQQKSNFARAVYPVVKHLFDEGLIHEDDEDV